RREGPSLLGRSRVRWPRDHQGGRIPVSRVELDAREVPITLDTLGDREDRVDGNRHAGVGLAARNADGADRDPVANRNRPGRAGTPWMDAERLHGIGEGIGRGSPGFPLSLTFD